MKKTILFAMIIILLVTCLSGCSTPTEDEAYTLLTEAIATSKQAEIYYWKELVKNGEGTAITRVNVYGELGSKGDGYPYLRNQNGEIVGYKVNVFHSMDGVSARDIYCGVPSKQMVSRKAVYENGAKTPVVTEGITAKEYVGSAEFSEYTLSARLNELASIKQEDISYDIVNGGAKTKGNVTTLVCKLTDAYHAAYEAEHGKPSLLKGSYVTIELSYGRVSNVLVSELGEDASLGYESYKLEISYMGPKFEVPQ